VPPLEEHQARAGHGRTLARLEGEMSRDGIDGAGRVGLIILNNQGPGRLDPEVFREAARRKALEQRGGLVDADD
jgi:hypothetical protein